MGLLDNVLGGLFGGNGGTQNSPVQGILQNMLAGGQGMGGGNMQSAPSSGLGGGLGGLLQSFENVGLGHVAQSWVGNGPNHPVSPDQLQQVFGQDRVNSMANQAGMAPNDFLGQLSQHLPHAVDGMTPNGQLPNEGSASV